MIMDRLFIDFNQILALYLQDFELYWLGCYKVFLHIYVTT